MFYGIFCSHVLLLFLLLRNGESKTNTVSVSLDARWNNTPLIAEASEYLSSESHLLFWKFVDSLSSRVSELSVGDDESEYRLIVSLASGLFLSASDIDMLKLCLASRVYSPAVEMNVRMAQSDREEGATCPDGATVATWALVESITREKVDVLCSLQGLTDYLKKLESVKPVKKEGSVDNSTSPLVLFRTDKIYSWMDAGGDEAKSSSSRHRIIVYGDLRTADFYTFHKALRKAAESGLITYVFRHYVMNPSPRKTRLVGYGIELTIKSTEYKAVDDTKVEKSTGAGSEDSKSVEEDEVQGFIFSQLRSNHPNLSENLASFKKHLIDGDTEIRPLKAWQFQELSLQASFEVAKAQEHGKGLQVLRDLSQNYPLRASALSEVRVTPEFRQEMQANQRLLESEYNLTPGQFYFTLNGHVVRDLDVFAILELARREIKAMNALHNLGITGTHITSLLSTPLSGSTSTKYALDIRSAPVIYLNDLEHDRRYQSWPTSVQDLLTPAYPGMLRRVSKNLFHLVLVVDPSQPEAREAVKYAEAFIVHLAPVRMGFLWAVDPSVDSETSPGRALIRAFNFVMVEHESPLKALSFITEVYSKTTEVTVERVKEIFQETYRDADLDTVFGKDSDYDTNVRPSWDYLTNSGLSVKKDPVILLNGNQLDSKSLEESGFEDVVVTAVLEQTGELQKAVYEGHVTDGRPVLDYLMEKSNVVERLNQRLLNKEGAKFLRFDVALSKEQRKKKDLDVDKLNDEELTAFIADTMKYFVKKEDKNAVHPVSIWVVTDLSTPEGRLILYEAFKNLKSSTTRIGIIHNPAHAYTGSTAPWVELARALYVTAERVSPLSARNYATKLVKEENVEAKRSLEDLSVGGMNFEDFKKDFDAQKLDFLHAHGAFVRRVLKFQPGQRGVISNGKIFGPLGPQESFTAQDFKLTDRLSLDSGASQISARLSELNLDSDVSDLTMRATCILSSVAIEQTKTSQGGQDGGSSESGKRVEIKGLHESQNAGSILKISGDSKRPALDLVVVLDPLTREVQKAAHFLIVLTQAVNVNLKIIFNAKQKLSDAPLKSFYRYVWSPSVVEADGTLSNPRAFFTRMPGQPLLTMAVDAPHSWLVEAVNAVHDLDNLRLADADGQIVQARFELEYLLLEGHCVDMTTGQPPRGLQFTLGTKVNTDIYDTIVMANLGYFQLKANPGAWYLNLRAGKSMEIYTIHSHDNTDSTPGSSDVVSVLDNFRPKIIRVRVSKKPDKMQNSVLSDGDNANEDDSFWSSISSAFRPSGTVKSEETQTLNIFSLASGHLYERFLRLMMLSVMKHTKSRVKFWFLKNYLSPSFKDFIPHMAREYDFDYELVQYKWPRWLHQQTEKQRIIWGYKILFLDVLFPLSVKKIIFVDADQIVRTDMQELADLDLEGAPYGYTPFCTSRREMDGFRFWSSGYWAQHLAGRSYHISALYVVDLTRFRLMAAGDRLRGQYHGLSQDPNSLANLDQDLPNNMIHQVPIKSLPQEWLWCETWCSDADKARAKTIDLCNNPRTKEPKLSAAMRILPEWRGFDQEVKRLWDSVYGTKTAEGADTQSTMDMGDKNKKDTTTQKPDSHGHGEL